MNYCQVFAEAELADNEVFVYGRVRGEGTEQKVIQTGLYLQELCCQQEIEIVKGASQPTHF